MYIQHVSIPRPLGQASREQAKAFYNGLLGLKVKPEPKSIEHLDIVWFDIGVAELHCFGEDPIDDKSGRHFCLVVDDVKAIEKKLSAAGYEPWTPEDIPGRPRFFCRDPFGNTIEFAEILGNYLELEQEGN